ncbi:MAG TPA: hypothetical protein VGP82_22175 [Ktedonobacterales bacterium]|nr:hypothetical protein [Ktedonobacterales bacterium]
MQERSGKERIDQLRQSLWEIASQFDMDLPDCLPILGIGLFSRGRHPGDDRYPVRPGDHEQQALAGDEDSTGAQLPLSALLARVLLAFAIEYERGQTCPWRAAPTCCASSTSKVCGCERCRA